MLERLIYLLTFLETELGNFSQQNLIGVPASCKHVYISQRRGATQCFILFTRLPSFNYSIIIAVISIVFLWLDATIVENVGFVIDGY